MPTQTKQTISQMADRLLFIVDAVSDRGLTYKQASALWADGIDTLYTSVESE